ncbi:putative ATP-dependent RNA helicase ROK1 [Blattamonas nauphoetae]|uniref:RNA helicase n=1 Tax=Blattamonas nauphoetae TaxID=2049346 RepID=A0ABQ9YLM6_9EUKA|nr:putative ATP-dependent RNA helicase ROK1 [Blattamonas nauphoetae]
MKTVFKPTKPTNSDQNESTQSEPSSSSWVDCDIFSMNPTEPKSNTPKKTKAIKLPSFSALREEDIKKLQKEQNVHVEGIKDWKKMDSFEGTLPDVILPNLTRLGFSIPTPIQMMAIPIMLDKISLVAIAPTGSGKTAAFMLPIIMNHLSYPSKSPHRRELQAVIIAPTRELEKQLFATAKTLCTGLDMTVSLPKVNDRSEHEHHYSLPPDTNILVTTPNPLISLITQDRHILRSIDWLVLDEADALLGDSFHSQIEAIINTTNASLTRYAFFTATYDTSFQDTLVKDKSPARLIIGIHSTPTTNVVQKLVFCGNEEGKYLALKDALIGENAILPPVAVFMQNIERCEELTAALTEDNIRVAQVHSAMSQQESAAALNRINSGDAWVLVCTELMSRGMDVRALNGVINYDFPSEAKSYVHRIGRSGRRRAGIALTFFTISDYPALRMVASAMKQAGCPVEDWMLNLPKMNKLQKKKLKVAPPKRHAISKVTSVRMDTKRKQKLLKKLEKRGKTMFGINKDRIKKKKHEDKETNRQQSKQKQTQSSKQSNVLEIEKKKAKKPLKPHLHPKK